MASGCTLIISEKPASAKKIAEALTDREPAEKKYRSVSYYEITHKGDKIIVGCAVGHLFTLTEKKRSITWSYPVFDVVWKPSYEASKTAYFTKNYLETIKKLAKMCTSYINACDLDREGELIFKNILDLVCGKKDAKRMKFSTLTKDELVDAYENISPHIDFGLASAGESRHMLDYFWGVSVSRALIQALKTSGGYKTLSTGRVQGPTLNLLEEREMEIKSFKPRPFWQLELQGLLKKDTITAYHTNDKFWKRKEAEEIFNRCRGKPASVEAVEKKQHKQAVPVPFDLTTLQREAYRNFGYSPKQTLDIAQTLYEHALISYPRTSSQKLPAKLGLKKIIKNLAKNRNYAILCEKLLDKKQLKPVEGKKVDPAHPAIFPTGHGPQKLNTYQLRLYDLIARRFLSVFSDPAVRESVRIFISIEGETFVADGVRTLKPNWMEFYGPYARFKEQILPPAKQGDKVGVKKLEVLDKETQPPNRYTQGSILKKLEDLGLGTKATRAQILHTLYDRNYIKERSIVVTRLGEIVTQTLKKYCPEIVSPHLTVKLEKDMDAIQHGKEKSEKVIEEAKKTLKKILDTFRKHEKKIGKELMGGLKEVWKEETTIGKCKCGGTLLIRRTNQNKPFVGCDKYPKCTQTYSLPHQGYLTILEDTHTCGLHIVSVKRFRRKPWKLCVKCGFVNKLKKKGKE